MGQLTATGRQASLALAADPTKWIEPIVLSCLDSSTWDHTDWLAAKRLLAEHRIDVPETLKQVRTMLAPVEPKWLADRLRALWQSTIPSGSLRAEAWLAETGRLLKHLPLDIVSAAIDQAVANSARGFTPTAGEILAIAKPLLAKRRAVEIRLRDIANGRPLRPGEVRDTFRPEDRCTPEQAREIRARFGLEAAFDAEKAPSPRELREPTKEELEQVAREFKASR